MEEGIVVQRVAGLRSWLAGDARSWMLLKIPTVLWTSVAMFLCAVRTCRSGDFECRRDVHVSGNLGALREQVFEDVVAQCYAMLVRTRVILVLDKMGNKLLRRSHYACCATSSTTLPSVPLLGFGPLDSTHNTGASRLLWAKRDFASPMYSGSIS